MFQMFCQLCDFIKKNMENSTFASFLTLLFCFQVCVRTFLPTYVCRNQKRLKNTAKNQDSIVVSVTFSDLNRPLWDGRKHQIVLCMVWGSIYCQANPFKCKVAKVVKLFYKIAVPFWNFFSFFCEKSEKMWVRNVWETKQRAQRWHTKRDCFYAKGRRWVEFNEIFQFVFFLEDYNLQSLFCTYFALMLCLLSRNFVENHRFTD